MYKQPENLERGRVLDALQQAANCPVAIVCAGAGYGKTTAVKQFIASRQAACVYITIKPVHNLPEAFWLEFLAKMDACYPDYAQKLREIGAPIEVTQFGGFVHVIGEMVAQYGDLYVVLDDFHLLHDAQTLRFISLALWQRLPGLKIFLVSRSEPLVDVSSLEAEGLVARLGPQELAFREDEVASFIYARADAGNHRLAGHIMKQTDGWPMAVMLLYHTLSPEKSLDDSIEDVRPLMNSTMHKLFFSEYPLPIRRGLVLLSLCENIYPGLVETVRDCSMGLLQELTAHNPFISVDAGGVLRMHMLYQEFLATQTGILAEEEITAHYNSAGDWLLENGHLFESVASYRKAGNFAAAWDVIKRQRGPMPSRSFVGLCCDILDETPGEVFAADGTILLHAVFILLCARQAGRARELLENAAAQYAPEVCGVAMRGEYELLYGLSLFLAYDEAFLPHWECAYELLLPSSQLVDGRFRLLNVMPLFAYKSLAPASVEGFNRACGKGLPLFMVMSGGSGAAMLEELLAEGHYFRGEHGQALELFAQAEKLALQHEQYDILVSAAFYSFQCAVHLGQYETAMRNYTLIQDYSVKNRLSNIIHPFADEALAFLNILLGKRAPGKRFFTDDSERMLLHVRGLYAATVMLGLSESSDTYRQALEFMQSKEEALRSQCLHMPACYIFTLASYVAAESGMTSYSYLLLEEAYKTSGDGMYITGLTQGGAKTLRAVEHYRAKREQGIPAGWLDRLCAATTQWMHNLAQMAEYQTEEQK